jgi:hypothetical protein
MTAPPRAAVTSRPGTAAALLGIAVLAVAGCGSQGVARSKPIVARFPFADVHAAPAPAGWRATAIASGAVLSYPPDWTPVGGDPGTASAALAGARQHIIGYLNVTPLQGSESLANWPEFRVRHNAAEGDRAVTTEATAYGVRFLTGTGSCVRDSYTTVSRARYVELACLVAGAHARSVIVAAAARAQWIKISPVLYRALSAFRT